MIWTLNKLGTFEENLDRVGQAGYHHVELVGEFKNGQRTIIAASSRAWRR